MSRKHRLRCSYYTDTTNSSGIGPKRIGNLPNMCMNEKELPLPTRTTEGEVPTKL